MKDDQKKYLKYAAIVVLLIVIIAILWYVFKPADTTGTWDAVKGGDISGSQYDILIDDSGLSLDAAKKKAVELKAKSFLQNGSRTVFKNVNAPISNSDGNYILYVKK